MAFLGITVCCDSTLREYDAEALGARMKAVVGSAIFCLGGCGGLQALAVYSGGPLGITPDGMGDSGLITVVTSTPSTPGDGGGGGSESNKLIFSEVCDHATLEGIKYVELYNAGNQAINLDGWKILRYANGSPLAAEHLLPDENLGKDSMWVVAYSDAVTEFESAYGPASEYASAINGNGDDVYVLVYEDNDNIKDIYGEIGVDGTGTAWEYLNSVAQRATSVKVGSTVWSAGEWNISAGAGNASPGLR